METTTREELVDMVGKRDLLIHALRSEIEQLKEQIEKPYMLVEFETDGDFMDRFATFELAEQELVKRIKNEKGWEKCKAYNWVINRDFKKPIIGYRKKQGYGTTTLFITKGPKDEQNGI